MPRISALLLIVAATLSAAFGAAAPQQDAAPALSPGALALLLDGTLGPTELARCRTALGGARADARAVAARVARVGEMAGLVPALLDAIAVETDLDAAREQLAALGWLAADHADEALFAAAKRFDGRLDEALIKSLAARGPAAFSLAPRLMGLKPTQEPGGRSSAGRRAAGERDSRRPSRRRSRSARPRRGPRCSRSWRRPNSPSRTRPSPARSRTPPHASASGLIGTC